MTRTIDVTFFWVGDDLTIGQAGKIHEALENHVKRYFQDSDYTVELKVVVTPWSEKAPRYVATQAFVTRGAKFAGSYDQRMALALKAAGMSILIEQGDSTWLPEMGR